MRDILVFAAVFGMLPFVFKRPMIGVLMFVCMSILNPHRLTYGAAYSFPFAAIIALVTLLAMLFRAREGRFTLSPLTSALLIFIAWCTVTTFFALLPVAAWTEWERVMKTMFMVCVAIFLLQTKKDVQDLAWVLALSLGFYGAKGGLFTILSGGRFMVVGPESTYISDNNTLALALITVIPLMWFCALQAKHNWLKYLMIFIALLTLIAVAGSYSRGALIGGGAMLFFLWIKSDKKLFTGFLILIAVPLVVLMMPPEWFARMASISDYKQDGSALGRINAWYFGANVAASNLFGGGFGVFNPSLFLIYAPNPTDYHVAHSIYFQVLGDHGYLGLIFFMVLMIIFWFSCSKIIKQGNAMGLEKWVFDLASMTQASLVAFAFGGAFLSLPYFDLYYFLIAMIVGTSSVVFSHSHPKTSFTNRINAAKSA